uniref:Energy-coupling factor transporter transmembrane protein EcfT n=1 Tax=Fervidobacterium thailandense TaxID=1008305 RepID=A0A7C4RVD0_9BACT
MKLTIGKYVPKSSPVHSLDPRSKMISTLVGITSVLLVRDLWEYVLPGGFLLLLMFLSRIKLRVYLRSLKSVWFLLTFAILVQYWLSGPREAVYIALRLALIFLYASVLTFTTPPLLLARGIVDLLKIFRVKDETREDFGMMLAISIRFIPILLDETDRIIKAQTARGARYTEKGLTNKLTLITSVVVPLLVSSLRKAEELSLALMARKYGIGKRTHYYQLRWQKSDTAYVCFQVLMLLLLALI